MPFDSTPTLADLTAYQVNRNGQAEVFRQTLYDFQLYPTAGQQQFTFFQLPQGQGKTSTPGAVVASPKIKNDTNMESNGILPSPKAFLIESIEVMFLPGSVATADTYTPAGIGAAVLGSSANDVNTVLQAGGLQLFIGSKEYLYESPLFRFPPKTHFDVDGFAAATAAGVVSQVTYAGGRPYFVDPPISLTATQNFSVNIFFGAATATPSGFNGRIGVIMDGYFFRNSQ